MNQVDSLEGFAAALGQRLATTWSPIYHPVPGEDSENEFNRRALELFSLQLANNRDYRRFCESRGLSIAEVEDWTGIPAVPASAFKECELTSIPQEERIAVFFSSGTSGRRPSRHFHNTTSLAIYEASLLAWFEPHLLGGGPADLLSGAPAASSGTGQKCFVGRVLGLTPPAEQAPHSSLVHMFETLRRTLNCHGFLFAGRLATEGDWELDCGRALSFLQTAIEQGEPVLLLGTAFSYVHLLDYLAERGLGLRLPSGSLALETGGYKGRSRVLAKTELHEYLTSRLGVAASHIVCEYGMSELSSQAYDRIAPSLKRFGNTGPENDQHLDRRTFRFPPWTRVQIISPENGGEVSVGETGLIRVFDLANVYSVMAIQTEDLAIRREQGFELIGRAASAEARGCSLMAG